MKICVLVKQGPDKDSDIKLEKTITASHLNILHSQGAISTKNLMTYIENDKNKNMNLEIDSDIRNSYPW